MIVNLDCNKTEELETKSSRLHIDPDTPTVQLPTQSNKSPEG